MDLHLFKLIMPIFYLVIITNRQVNIIIQQTMIRVIKGIVMKHSQLGSTLLKNGYGFDSNEKKIPVSSQRHAILIKKLRSTTNLDDSIDVVIQNMEQINKLGKTLTLQFFNEFYMEQRYNNIEKFVRLQNLLHQFKNLTLYQKFVKLCIMKKIHIYFQYQPYKDSFEKKIQLCVNDIIDDFDQKKDIDIFDALNLLMGFKIQQNLPILIKALDVVERTILDLDQNMNLSKTWLILLHQFGYVQWAYLRNYKNIIYYLTSRMSVPFTKQKIYVLADYFHKLAVLEFHKIGPQKMPIFLSQAIKYLAPLINDLSLQQLCSMIQATSKLPPGFHPEFQNALVKRLMETQKVTSLCAQIFPYSGLSTNQINMIYEKKQNHNALWFSIVYQATPQRQQYFFRGAIMDYFRELIHSKQKLEQKFDGDNNRPFQIAARYCHLARYFSLIGDDETVEVVKKILIQYFEKYGFQRLTNQFSTSSFLYMMQLFQNMPIFLSQIKAKYNDLFNLRISKNRFGKARQNVLATIQYNIQSPMSDVRQGVLQSIKYLIKQESLDWHYDTLVLFQILNTSEYQKLTEQKQKIWLKIKTPEQFQILLDYYIKYHKKTFKGCQQLVKKFQHYNTDLLTVFKFISVLSPKFLQNNRGRIEQNLGNYIINPKHKFQGNLSNLNQVNRALSVLSQYDIRDFLKKMYFNTLNNIQNQIKQPSWKLNNDSSMLILNFLFKFQKLIDSNQLNNSVNKSALEKIFEIMKIILKQDKHLYVKAKFVEFCLIYKQYIHIKEGQQFQCYIQLQQALKSKQNPQLIGQVYFILLKLHCFKLQELQPSIAVQYSSILSKSVSEGRFSIFQAVKHVNSILYEMKIQKIQNSQLQLFKQVVSPIFLKVLQLSTKDTQFNILKPFFIYFLKTNEITKMNNFLLKILRGFVTPHVLQGIISIYPISLLNQETFQLLIKKIQLNQNLLDNNSVKILFYIQKIFFSTPEKYKYFFETLWNVTNKYLYKKILVINSKQMNYDLQSYKLGRFPLYMFACIKSGRTDSKIFKHLSNFVKKNPKAFLQKVKSNEFLKSINQNILNYIRSQNIQDFVPDKKPQIKKNFEKRVQIFSNMNFSRQFEENLMKQKVQYKKNWVVDGVLVPYYIQSRNQVVMIANKHNQIGITAKVPFNGVTKFHYEVLKKCLKSKNIKIYDDVNKIMLQV